jgi:large subunit ribosomal protein L10
MAKTRARKETDIGRYTKELKGMKAVVFADLSALKVADSTDLRRKSKEADVAVMTSKKTLLRLALKEVKTAAVDEGALKGSVSMLLAHGDEIAPAKVLETFRKTHENAVVLGGLLESKWLSAADIKALAQLPSKQQLIASVVGTIRAPLTGLVGVLQGNLRKFVYALNAIKDSKSA